MAACRVQTGVDLIRTEHRPPTQTPFAPPAGGLNPGHADPVAYSARSDARPDGDDFPDRLVPKDAREWSRQLAIGLVHVREAQAAGVHLDQHLVGTRIGCGNLFDFPSASDSWNNRSFHLFSFVYENASLCRIGSPHVQLGRVDQTDTTIV